MNDDKNNLPDLPDGWVWTKLGEVCLKPQYGWTTSAATEGGIQLLRTTDITSGSIDWDSVPFCKKEPSDKEKYLLEDGDIVISRAGSVGYSYLLKNPKESVFASYLIRFKPLIEGRYLAFFLKSPSYWSAISDKSIGIALPNVNATKLKQIFLPLPPLAEQRRIVAKIEELFTKLDTGIESLKKAQVQLKRYRQAVLKSAMEGKLTEDWRSAHKDKLEPASVLLERIEEERKKKTEQSKKLPPLETSDLPKLPEGWVWTRIGAIMEPSKEKVDPLEIEEIPYISLGHIEKDTGKLLGHGFSTEIKSTKTKFCIGDLLYGKLRPYLNKVHVAKFEGVCSTDILVFSKKDCLSNTYFLYRFLCRDFVNYASQNVRGVNLPRVDFRTLSKFEIPFPPLAEQYKIVEEIERRLSVADEVEKTVESELKRSERLRQAILKQAFSGKLVPQDPNDEPVSVWLKKIKAEKARQESKKKSRKRLKTKENAKQLRLL